MTKHDDPTSISQAEIDALRERIRHGSLQPEDGPLLDRLLGQLSSLIFLLQQKNASIKRLKRWLFGPGSDTRQAKSKTESHAAETGTGTAPAPQTDEASRSATPKPGHGRLAASAYTGATVVQCTDQQLAPGAACPDQLCPGHLYDTHAPAVLIRLTGQPIVHATSYQQQVVRCSACQTRFTAPLPDGVSPQKYAPSADVAIVLAKYAAGLPFYRLARLQQACGIPLPESVQFMRCEAVADAVLPVFLSLRGQAAGGEVLYADDTRVRVLELMKENKHLAEGQRRGMQTTGIVARVGEHEIALYQSGRRHAGENIAELLRQREPGLRPPIQMGDAQSNNWDHEFATIIAKCLAHARMQFVEIEEAFPEKCGRVLNDLAKVYSFDKQTRGMSAEERLEYHQHHSGPVMEELREWIAEQLSKREVEANSAVGKAFRYMQRHWPELTQFLQTAGSPLDNNVVERALKLVVLQRKNGLFFKTEHGAAVGDILSSMIETCRLNRVNAWSYLLALVNNAREVRKDPAAWLPWNYARDGTQQCAA